MIFLDTNVLVHAWDQGAPEKREISREVMQGEERAVSTQVMREFYSVSRHKLGRLHESVLADLRALLGFRVVSLSPESIVKAADWVPRYDLSIWDAMIVRAAHEAGCERVLTEDMTHGAVIEGIRIENPFRDL